MKLFEGYSKVDLKEITIVSFKSGKRLDIRSSVSAIEVFSSILDPSMTCKVYINDRSGEIINLQLSGEEIITLSFQTPGRKAFEQVFQLFTLENQEYDPNGTAVSYVIRGISFDHFNATKISISQGFIKQTCSDIVTGLLQQTIKTKNDIFVEASNGAENIVSPSWTSLQLFEYLRLRAISPNYISPYLFFEDNNGYHFKSVEYLINERKDRANTYTALSYVQNTETNNYKPTVNSKQYRNAFQFEVIQSFDMNKLVGSGGISSATYVFDIVNKTVEQLNHNYNDLSNLIKIPFAKQYIQTVSKEVADDSRIVEKTSQYMIPVDYSNPSSYPKNYAYKRMFTEVLNTHQIGFSVNGDSELNPGDIFYFMAPLRSNNTKEDKAVSGNHILVNLCHTITQGSMISTIEAAKIGLAT